MITLPCAIYTRKSSEEGLEQGFNSLDAQREACEALILSQKSQGWKAAGCYDDGGYSGGNIERPALNRLLADIAQRRVRVVVVYKVDRLTRSLADFAKLVELFDSHGVSFVSVTQQFNTTTSMGRLTLNVLLSFAQFEREVTGERIRDKIAASKRKGMWMGGYAPLGYVPNERSLAVDEPQAERVREIFRLYLSLGSVAELQAELDRRAWKTPAREGRRPGGNRPFSRGHLYRLLASQIYIGRIPHKGQHYTGLHAPIIDVDTWDKVQAQLARNAQRYSEKSHVADASLLAGLLFDDQGVRLHPTHAKKGGKRYRYYIRKQDADSPNPLRIPGQELERLVQIEVVRFLRDEQQVVAQMPGANANEARAGIATSLAIAERLDGDEADRLRKLKYLVTRVIVGPQTIQIGLRTAFLKPSTEVDRTAAGSTPKVDADAVDSDVHWISVPAELKRRGQAVRLIVRGPDESKVAEPNPRLVALLSKAHRWFEALKSGKSPSVLSIAQEQRVESSDVTQVVYLAFLAPDIVEQLVRGDHPAEFGVKRLLSLSPLPMDWVEQRRVLGLAG